MVYISSHLVTARKTKAILAAVLILSEQSLCPGGRDLAPALDLDFLTRKLRHPFPA